MTTLTPPDTVVPAVDITALRVTPESQLSRPPVARRPLKMEQARHYPPLNRHTTMEYEPPVMRRDEVRHKPVPAFVPFTMGRRVGDDDVIWTPPPPKPPPQIDVSIAETVEVPVRGPPPKFYDPPKTRLLAYDDSDPFPSTVRRLRNIDQLEPSGVRSGTCPVLLWGVRAVIFTLDHSLLWVLDTTSLADGWRKIPCLGVAPPLGTLLLVNDRENLIVGLAGDEYFILELLPGEPEARWVRCAVKGTWARFTVTWAAWVDEASIYVRSETEHALVTPDPKLRAWPVPRERLLFPVGSRIVSPHQQLCVADTLRSTPVSERLEPVPGLPGIALLIQRDHVWLYCFLFRARNFLPCKRVDVSAAFRVLMPQGLYFFSTPPQARRSNTFVATHRVLPPVANLREAKALPTIEVVDASRDGEVVVCAEPDNVAALIPMQDECVAILAKDMETYLVIELDRVARVKSFLEPPPGAKAEPVLDPVKLLTA